MAPRFKQLQSKGGMVVDGLTLCRCYNLVYMTLAELQTKANTVLADFWSALKTREDAYFVKHGRYFQLLASPAIVVSDGTDSTFTTSLPAYEVDSADIAFTYSSPVPFRIAVHQWVDPKNNRVGYTGMVFVKLLDGRVFWRKRNNFNEDTGWSELESDIDPLK